VNPWSRLLIIGYGSMIRGDDGVGPLLAERLAAYPISQVKALSVHQLTPELAAELSWTDAALFLDASRLPLSRPRWRRTWSGDASSLGDLRWADSHGSRPGDLLDLSRRLYGSEPVAWTIALPAHSFELGAPLSPAAWDGLLRAESQIGRMLHRPGVSR
jgi:hydrogenase maturation protease